MKKTSCMFNSVEEAEAARKKLISECSGGDCKIKELEKYEEKSNLSFYATPSNFGVNIAPQTPADIGALQMTSPVEFKNNKNRKCLLSYIGFNEQAKHAEALLYNLGGENISIKSYPKG